MNTPSRAAFEKWIASSPYEREILRYPDDSEKYAWPGSYRDIGVQLAWEAWCEAIEEISKRWNGLIEDQP